MGVVAQSPLLPRTQGGSGQEPGGHCLAQFSHPSISLPLPGPRGSPFVGKCARTVESPGEDFPVAREEGVVVEVGPEG